MIKNVNSSLCEVLFILVGFYLNFHFLDRFLKSLQSKLMKIRPVGAELLPVDTWMDRRTRRRYETLFAVMRIRLKMLQPMRDADKPVIVCMSYSYLPRNTQ